MKKEKSEKTAAAATPDGTMPLSDRKAGDAFARGCPGENCDFAAKDCRAKDFDFPAECRKEESSAKRAAMSENSVQSPAVFPEPDSGGSPEKEKAIPPEDEPGIGMKIRALATHFMRSLDRLPAFRELNGLTGPNAFIIGYLVSRKGKDTYQKDLEKRFSITRSTASKVVALMEQKGLVRTEADKTDKRMKKLMLTKKALAMHEKLDGERRAFEAAVTEDIPIDELTAFYGTLTKIHENLQLLQEGNHEKESQEE